MIFATSADKLPFSVIADHWSEETGSSLIKLLARLEAAWWRGEIKGNSDRLHMLKKMYAKRNELDRVLFVTPDDADPPAATPIEGERVLVYVTPRIAVPRESDNWTEKSCNEAFETLAELPSAEYFPLFGISIQYIDLTREEFFEWRRDLDVPKFWKAPTQKSIVSDYNSGGRPEEFDWDQIKRYAMQIMAKYGVPSKRNRKLPSKQALIEDICSEWAKKDIPLAEPTVRKHLNKWLREMPPADRN
jgi:hypothetical protein